jgi:peptidoglycan/LPS O-acetylase OafA/YrhL
MDSVLEDENMAAPGTIWVPSHDGVRGFVVLTIVLMHVQFAINWVPNHEFPRALRSSSFFALEMMFLLAGFAAMLPVVASGAFLGARRYAIRRAGRLLPLYWLTIALAVALGGLLRPVTGLNHPHDVGTVLLHLTFLQHLVIPFKSGLGVHGVVWTMTIVACFYVVFALIAPLYLRHPLLGLAICLAVAVAWRTEVHILSRWYLQFPLFLSNFAIGMTAAWAYVRLRRSGVRASPAAAALVTVAALGAFVGLLYVAGLPVARRENPFSYNEGAPLNLAISAAFAAFLVALPFAPRWFQWPAGNRAARWLGTVSYGVFLFHFMVIWLVLRFVGIPRNGTLSSTFELAALVLPISLLCAWLGTRYVEDPLRRRARRAADRLGDSRVRPPVASPRPQPAETS